MRLLVVNAGSSSVKLSVVAPPDSTVATAELGAPDEAATHAALQRFVAEHDPLDAAVHRIVHGGPRLHDAVVVDDRVRAELDAVADLAPLHVPAALRLLDMLRAELRVPHVACFDTAFHASLPPAASTYAVPAAWREQGVRRYGFHGLSCSWSLRRAAALLGRPADDLQLLVAHLGAGASVTAIRDGRSADTSMGFTPLEGLVMATRSGSVDPGALLWLQTRRGLTAQELQDALEHDSGVLALAATADMRNVLGRAAAGDVAAVTARDVYVHRARAVIAAMAASLQRIDALVFTGGVGENAAAIRDAICAGLGVLGLAAPLRIPVDGDDAVISAGDASVAVLVVHAREDLEMARQAQAVLAA